MKRLRRESRARTPRNALVVIYVGLLFAGCAQDDDQKKNVPRFFDKNRLHDVRLTMSETDWGELREKLHENQYYGADVSIDGETLRNVGLRSRGGGTRHNPNKPGFRVDMNRYGDCQDYHGYTSLVLDNQLQDETFIRERLAYEVFEAMDVFAPRLSHARLWLNDAYVGLYTITEPVDRRFLETRFGEEVGNLFEYESISGEWNFSWRGESPSAYIPDPFVPRTNETSLDPSALVDFIRAINASTSETYARDLSKYIDPERFLTIAAIEIAIVEKDGIVGDWLLNNFYLYQFAGTTRFAFIPWDRDNSFRGSSWSVYRTLWRNVLTSRLMGIREYNDFYVNTIRHVVTTYVNQRWLLPRFEQAYRLTCEAALSDNNKLFTNEVYQSEVERLRQIILRREDNVLGQLGLTD
jgi:hypothetical protein